jgi:hypothetical protein
MGLARLELEACRVNNAKVTLAPERVGFFGNAPLHVREEVSQMQADHVREYESLLTDLASQPATEGADGDPRHGNHEEEGGPNEEPHGDWAMQTMESEAILKSAEEIKGESRTSGAHGVRMLKDAKGQVWLISSSDAITVPKWTILGGYGAGKKRILGTGEEAHRCTMPFQLYLGDRTPIILSGKPLQQTEGEDECGGGVPDTLYKVAGGHPGRHRNCSAHLRRVAHRALLNASSRRCEPPRW